MNSKSYLHFCMLSLLISHDFPVLSELAQVRQNLSIMRQLYSFYLTGNPKVLFHILLNKVYVLVLLVLLNA